jgi:hypothetical protein
MKRRRIPRPCLANAPLLAIELASKLSTDEQAQFKGIVTTAFDALRTGVHAAEQWPVMADALNVAEQLALIGICSDAASRDRIDAAQRVLAQQHQRHAARGSWTLYPAEITTLDDAAWLARVQIEHCSKGEFERAVNTARNKVRQARAGNAPRGALVIEGAIA